MIKAIVTDIEGTTTDIDFVHKVLFPYSTERLPDFVRQHAGESKVSAALAEAAYAAGIPGDDIEGLITALLQWIAEDRKITPLKTLQGLIWEHGYKSGDFHAHIYPDAVDVLQQWQRQKRALYVYSSGSTFAQKLLFGHTEAGDLRGLFSDYFDTTTGNKRDAASYRSIVRSIDLPATHIAFLSDVVEELDAATQAGMTTVWVQRQGELQHRSPHLSVRDFSEIDF
ncbi:acireductone synthase [Spongiibacter nanhainus]|uniref:Enolase-phosphatase E1 n=1 Tax=Spongiibacter nanhainus TaxID=2794344 RepID=A0A7T4R2Z0_9GAMM|nr:acireductone synthase [Spongiibacter nanhainus]QQD19367.1 acireductone synthase [Spongiibacter nanhainus]